jgi:phosphopantothenoylcysteine synthetase/decarboxylase
MRPNTKYSNDLPKTITLTNTSTGKKVEVEVGQMNERMITVFLANEKIILYKQGNHFIANKFGMELVYTP